MGKDINFIKKNFNFNENNTGYKVLFVVEVKKNGVFKDEPCTWVLMRESFYSKKSFLSRLPALLKEWGQDLIIKKNVAGKFLTIKNIEVLGQ